MKTKNRMHSRIKRIRRELAESPNGWPLCVMVGAEYTCTRTYRKMRDA